MATSWREPTCPACRIDFHRIQSGPEKGLGIYTKCWNCEAKDEAASAAAKAAEKRRTIVSESERHWKELRRRERGSRLADELGDEGPMPNPRRSSRVTFGPMEGSLFDGRSMTVFLDGKQAGDIEVDGTPDETTRIVTYVREKVAGYTVNLYDPASDKMSYKSFHVERGENPRLALTRAKDWAAETLDSKTRPNPQHWLSRLASR